MDHIEYNKFVFDGMLPVKASLKNRSFKQIWKMDSLYL